jgi:hypothetical protein
MAAVASPTVPSPVQAMQLLLVRSLLDRAQLAAREPNDVSLMTALLLADIAVETGVKQVITDHGVRVSRDANLYEMIDKLIGVLPGLANRPEVGSARRLRQARNPVQHAGQVPAAGAVSLHLQDARSFLRVLIEESFGWDFDAVSVAALVRRRELRAALASATADLQAGRVDVANTRAAAALEVVAVFWRRWLRIARGQDMRMEPYSPRLIHHLILQVFPMHPAAVEARLDSGDENDDQLLAIGFSIGELVRLRPLLRRAHQQAGEGPDKPIEPEPSPNDVAFLIEVSARQIWRLESTQPELFDAMRPWQPPLEQEASPPSPPKTSSEP